MTQTFNIRIKSPPPEEHMPGWVLKAWVGIVLVPLETDAKSQVFTVEAPKALKALEVHHSEAYTWWRKNMQDLMRSGYLTFAADACEILN